MIPQMNLLYVSVFQADKVVVNAHKIIKNMQLIMSSFALPAS